MISYLLLNFILSKTRKDKRLVLEAIKQNICVKYFISKELSAAFESVGIKCITIPKGLIENIYKLKGGEPDDSRTSIE